VGRFSGSLFCVAVSRPGLRIPWGVPSSTSPCPNGSCFRLILIFSCLILLETLPVVFTKGTDSIFCVGGSSGFTAVGSICVVLNGGTVTFGVGVVCKRKCLIATCRFPGATRNGLGPAFGSLMFHNSDIVSLKAASIFKRITEEMRQHPSQPT
jgi:hypothetical protein